MSKRAQKMVGSNFKSPSKVGSPAKRSFPLSQEDQARNERDLQDRNNMTAAKINSIFEEDDDVDEVEDVNDALIDVRRPDHNIPLVKPLSSRPALQATGFPMAKTQAFDGNKTFRPASLYSPSQPVARHLGQNTYQRKALPKQGPLFSSIFGSRDQRSLWSSPSVVSRPLLPQGTVGLRNLGNSCYINASLQALLVMDRLVAALCKEEVVARVKSATAEDKVSLFEAFRSFWKETQSNKHVVSPENIKKLIAVENARFSGFQQEDAHEFMSVMLNAMEEEFCETTKSKTGPVFDHLSMVVQNTLECADCHETKTFEEIYLDLALEVAGNSKAEEHDVIEIFSLGEEEPEVKRARTGPVETPSVQFLVEKFMETELNVEWKCPKGCQSERASLSHKFARSPKVLMLQLKRFDVNEAGTDFVKIATAVEVSEYLLLSSMALSNMAGGPLFRLKAVVQHIGDSIRHGHYICFGRKKDQWYKHDDSRVEKCSTELAFEGKKVRESAYMLLYEREEE